MNNIAIPKLSSDVSEEVISVDLETSGLNPKKDFIVGVSVGWKDPILKTVQGIYFPIAHKTGENISPEFLLEVLDFIKVRKIIAWNATFELMWFREKYGIDLNIVSDPQVAAKMMQYLEKGIGLKDCAASCLKVSVIKLEDVLGKDNFDFSTVDAQNPKAIAYGVQDSVLAVKMHDFFMQKITSSKMLDVYNLEVDIVRIMAKESLAGYIIDETQIADKLVQFETETADLERQIFDLLGVLPFAINSNKQLGDILFGRLGLEPAKWTKKGAISCSAEALEDLKYQHPAIPLILLWKSRANVRNTLKNIGDYIGD